MADLPTCGNCGKSYRGGKRGLNNHLARSEECDQFYADANYKRQRTVQVGMDEQTRDEIMAHGDSDDGHDSDSGKEDSCLLYTSPSPRD